MLYTSLEPELKVFLLHAILEIVGIHVKYQAMIVSQQSHCSLYRLVGVCIDPNPKTVGHPVYIITEHMQGGVFLQFLKERGSSVTKKQLCRMCADVCKVLLLSI